jgi:hypothetical protein
MAKKPTISDIYASNKMDVKFWFPHQRKSKFSTSCNIFSKMIDIDSVNFDSQIGMATQQNLIPRSSEIQLSVINKHSSNFDSQDGRGPSLSTHHPAAVNLPYSLILAISSQNSQRSLSNHLLSSPRAMGKKDFGAIYRDACCLLGLETASIKVSAFCDKYDPDKNYAGIILYHHGGMYKWKSPKGGIAQGCNCQSFYVYIRCTDQWSGADFKAAGEGKVHDKMFKDVFRVGFTTKRSCCGGFAIMKGTRKYSSIWLNKQESKRTKLKWESDGSHILSGGEIKLVDLAIDKWIEEGVHKIVHVPRSLHRQILKL